MCGRFTLRVPLGRLLHEFAAEYFGERQLELFGPRYNVAPTQEVWIVRPLAEDRARRELVAVRWGLVPRWSRPPLSGAPLINARGETVREKPSFRDAMKSRRCLLLADGFYEWLTEGTGRAARKQPFFIHYPDDRPFVFAALWERWRDPTAGTVLESCTLVNTAAVGWMTEIHHRMPILLSPAEQTRWLDVATHPADSCDDLLAPRDYPDLESRPVSTHVNRVQHDDPACLAAEPELF